MPRLAPPFKVALIMSSCYSLIATSLIFLGVVILRDAGVAANRELVVAQSAAASSVAVISSYSSEGAISVPVPAEVLSVTIAFILPSQNLTSTSTRNRLRHFLSDGLMPRSTRRQVHRLQVNPVYALNLSLSQVARSVFCSRAAKGLNAMLIITDKTVQGDDGTRIDNFLTSLAKLAGIPVMTWSDSAHELESGAVDDSSRLILAPSIRDQAAAIFAFLKTQPWQRFSIVYSTLTPGHDIFASELYDLADNERKSTRFVDIHRQHSDSRLNYVAKLKANWQQTIREELLYVRDSAKSKVLILYAKINEVNEIFSEARTLGMTAEDYLFVCAKPALGVEDDHGSAPLNFVPGTVIASYETSFDAQTEVVKGATQIWSIAVRRLLQMRQVSADSLAPAPFCDLDKAPPRWPHYELFVKLLRQARSEIERGDDDAFSISNKVHLSFLSHNRQWVHFGEWSAAEGLLANGSDWGQIKSGQSDATVLRIATLEESPYVVYSAMGHSGSCPRASVPCELTAKLNVDHNHENDTAMLPLGDDLNPLRTDHIINGTWACCSGFTIDLLQRLAADIGFKYHLFEVEDRKWGARDVYTGQWNGLVKAILENEADLVVTSLKINKERSEAIDFSLPFLETGITMVVAVRQGAISPMAFLEPFSPTAWMAILLGCVNAVVLASFIFEYVSVKGDCSGEPHSGQRKRLRQSALFSLLSLLWMVWSMLFKAAVKMRVPRSYGAKLLTGVWGMFCVIFASSYMANLAVFMITKDYYYDFSGIEDYRLKNPYTRNPPYRFATVASGATEMFFKQNYPDMYEYMRPLNKSSASTGIEAVKKGVLDAFIYDATVLEYKSSRDKDCRLTTVGKWYAMTGYGIAFPKGSKWLPIIDKYIIDYQHNSFLQQLTEFWLSGACKRHKKQETNKSFQLGVLNFTSAFVLLLLGLGVCIVILILENLCSKYITRFLGMSAVRQKIRQQLVKSYLLSPAKYKYDMGTIWLNSITCDNCGGRGHNARKCASPRMRLLRIPANLAANNSKDCQIN